MNLNLLYIFVFIVIIVVFYILFVYIKKYIGFSSPFIKHAKAIAQIGASQIHSSAPTISKPHTFRSIYARKKEIDPLSIFDCSPSSSSAQAPSYDFNENKYSPGYEDW
jgi:hypothetical protein